MYRVTYFESAHPRTHRPDGPPAGVLAVLVLGFTIGSVVAYVNESSHWQGVFLFAASVPLGIYAATMYARLLRLGVRVPGPNISFVGGVTASVLGAAAGLLLWAQGRADGVPTAVDDLVTDVSFALGGVGMVGGLGLLIAGIAVPCVILHLVPRWLGWSGLALAAIGEVSFFAMIWSDLDPLLPITRFLSLIWLAVVGFRLPHSRHEARRSQSPLPVQA